MKFHYLARALITSKDYFVGAREIGGKHTFFPGGHIEFGEKADVALKREILEELGAVGEVVSFIGAVESKWEYNKKFHSEINLIFHFHSDELSPGKELVSQERHLEFLWIHKDECEKYNLLPEPMRKIVSKIPLIDSAFWGSDY